MLATRLDRLRRHPAYPPVILGLVVAALTSLGLLLTDQLDGYGHASPGAPDYIAYWSAGQLLLRGDSPYDFDKLREVEDANGLTTAFTIKVWNPPWLLLWMAPVFVLPFRASALAWLAASTGMTLAGAALLWQTYADEKTRSRVGVAWLAAGFFMPTLLNLWMGQVSAFLLLGIAGFLYFSERGRDLPAGAFLALTTVKPHVVYLFLLAVAWRVVAERRWRIPGGAAAVLVPGVVFLALVRPEALTTYRAVIDNAPLQYYTPTLPGILTPWLSPENLKIKLYFPAVTGLLFLGTLLARRPVLDWRRHAGWVLLLSVTTSAYGWSFDQMVLLVPYLEIVLALATPGLATPRARGAVIGILLILNVAGVAQGIWWRGNHLHFWLAWGVAALYGWVRGWGRP